MPVVKINTGAKGSKPAASKTAVKAKGSTAAKPAAKTRSTAAKAAPKTAAKKTTTARKTAAAKPAASKAKTAVKRGTTAAKKTSAKTAPARKQASTGKADQRTIDAQVKKLTKIGTARKAAEQKHKDLVDQSYEAAQEALAKGVPTGVVASSLQMSRQWLYKIGNYSGRS